MSNKMTKEWIMCKTSEFLFQEQIDKFEEAADGINADMALAEKALKVGEGNLIRLG